MESVILTSYGEPPVLQTSTSQVKEPEQGEVLIRVAASPINPSDLIFLEGRNPNRRELPTVPGFEGSGTVIKSGGGHDADELVGKNVSFRSKPDRDGAWAEYAVTDATRCIPLMEGVSLIAGAMMQVNPLTAWALVDTAQKQGHKCALQNAAASALGRMVIRFAAERGLELINIVRRQEQVRLLQTLGAKYILSSDDPDFDLILKRLVREHGATVIFDAIAGSGANKLLSAMPPRSELWSYGGLSSEPLQVDPVRLIYEEKVVRGFWGPPTFYRLPKDQFLAAAMQIQERMETTFKSEINAKFPLSQFAEAMTAYKNDMTKGKVVFVMGVE